MCTCIIATISVRDQLFNHIHATTISTRAGAGARPSTQLGGWPCGLKNGSGAHWIARQLTEAYGWQQTPRYIVRDRDCVYGDVVIKRLRAMGIRDRPISPLSPCQNGYSERLIGSIPTGFVSTMLLCSANGISAIYSILTKNITMRLGQHLSLHKDAPIRRTMQTVGRTLAMPVLGGLHHQYFRA